jgi:hypothetical protein
MTRALATLTILAAVVTSGVVQGVWTNRWVSTAALDRATARMAELPLNVGEWEGQAGSLEDRQLQLADASGHLLRRYVNRRTGDVVSVLLLCGRPGPMAVHTPDVCFGGMGLQPVKAPAKHAGPAGTGDLWVTVFKKDVPSGAEYMRIFHGWNAAGTWEAADNPRSRYARQPALFKLYVTRQLPRADEPLEGAPELNFLQAWLPAAQQGLFPAP